MENKQNLKRPLQFGEILDVSFQMIKEHFVKLFLIMLILMGPVYLIQSIAMLFGGASIWSQPAGAPWSEAFWESFEETGTIVDDVSTYGLVISVVLAILSGLLYIVSVPVADASIILAVDRVRKNESIQIESIIKQAFSRYGALLGGSVVYFLIIIGFMIAGGFISFMLSAPFANRSAGLIGISIFVFLILGCVIIYFTTRWSLYFPAIVFEKVSPGLSKSWKLSKGHLWRLIGLYLIVYIITGIISGVFEMGFQLLFGQSVLTAVFVNIIYMLVMLVYFVTFAIIYFDLRVRNEADDLKEMVEDYQSNMEQDAFDQNEVENKLDKDE